MLFGTHINVGIHHPHPANLVHFFSFAPELPGKKKEKEEHNQNFLCLCCWSYIVGSIRAYKVVPAATGTTAVLPSIRVFERKLICLYFQQRLLQPSLRDGCGIHQLLKLRQIGINSFFEIWINKFHGAGRGCCGREEKCVAVDGSCVSFSIKAWL